MIGWLVSMAVAGEMYTGSSQWVQRFDGRELTVVYDWQQPDFEFVGYSTLTFHRGDETLYSCYTYLPDPWDPWAVYLPGYRAWYLDGTYARIMEGCPDAGPGYDVYHPPTGTWFATGQSWNSEWIDPLDMAVGIDPISRTLEGVRYDGSLVPISAPILLQRHPGITSVSYDGDTRLIWLIGGPYNSINVVAVEPEGMQVVAEANTSLIPYFATGYHDTHPDQTPELLVTGECPGTVYVTLVDGTPGGHAFLATGPAEGTTVMPAGGACGGTVSGLASPQRRGSLPINSYGIASTTFTTLPQHCGALKVQALDGPTCMTTQVRTVPGP